MSYSDITRNNVQTNISFPLNERDFPSLSNVCEPILFNVNHVCINIKRLVMCVSAHESLVYAGSVSELAKPLNVSKRVCSNNATKRNACNASSTSYLIKSLNVSKTAFSSNATERNACKVSSVRKEV